MTPIPYYCDEWVTLYHGDCRDVLPSIDPKDVALVLTDPPYGISLQTDYASSKRGSRAQPKDYPPVHEDDRPFDPAPLLAFGKCVLFGANNYADKLPPSQSWIVWDRLSGTTTTADAELAWTNLGGTVRTFRHLWNGLCRDSEIGYHVHPTQKPVALMRWIIDKHTKPGDLILDPYAGSGPVARAAKDCGRRCIAIEYSADYCAIAADRLAQGVLDFEAAS